MSPKTHTAKELSIILSLVDQRVRRLARELFGVDKSAGKSSGVARQFNEVESFSIYLTAELIDASKFGMKNAVEATTAIVDLLQHQKFFPLSGWHQRTKQIAGNYGHIRSWFVDIGVTRDQTPIYSLRARLYRDEDNVKRETIGKSGSFFVYREDFIAMTISKSNDLKEPTIITSIPISRMQEEFWLRMAVTDYNENTDKKESLLQTLVDQLKDS